MSELPVDSLKTCVVLPAYNAANTIGPLVRQIRQLGLNAVVINDGSSDATAQIATNEGALVISHLHNEGKGTALRTGFAFVLQRGYEAVVTLDSDGQHDPQDIPLLLQAAKDPQIAIVVGQRRVEGSRMPLSRRWTNAVMSALVSTLAKQPMPDSQCGFRLVRREVLTTVSLFSRRFELETELLLAAARSGWKVAWIPIQTIYTQHTSHIDPLLDGLRFARLLIRYLLTPPVNGRP